jgi:acid phosphatase family membrane protein YuiD
LPVNLFKLDCHKNCENGEIQSSHLALILQLYLMQHRYGLDNPAIVAALIEVLVMRRFAGIDLLSD